MPLELIKEKIILDQRVGEERAQVLVEGDVIVPDVKPDIVKILQVDGRVNIDTVDVNTDRLNYTGKVEFNILYLAEGADKPVHSMMVSLPIDDFMNMDGLTRNMTVDVVYDIEHVDYKVLNGRKLNVKAVLEMVSRATDLMQNDIVVDFKGISGVQVQRQSLNLSRLIESKEDKFIIKDELSVPAGKPNIREILQCSANIRNKDIKVANGKVVLKGDLYITTLYSGDTDESTVEFMEHEVPFNGFVESRECTEEMFSDVGMKIQNQYVQVRPDLDGEERVLEVEIVVGARVRVMRVDDIQIIEDAYCLNKNLRLIQEKVKYQKMVCRNKNQCSVKETVTIDGAHPDILQVYNVVGRPKVDDIRIVDDKVVLEGIINASILYVAADDENPLCAHQEVIPFRQVVETKGAIAGMKVHVDPSIEHIGFNMLSNNEVEVRFTMSLNTQVTDEGEVDMITGAELKDLDMAVVDRMATMTIYVCQSADSLWKIAKRYNSSVQELAELNDIDNVNKVYPGQKLLILKKVMEE